MKALKAYFLSLQGRERVMISALCVLAAAVALTFFTKKAAAFWRAESVKLTRIKQNDGVIASRDAVDKRARDASAKLVPGQSLNQVQLISSVNQLASGASIRNPGINGLPDETIANSNLAIHSVRVTLNRVLWTNLRDFYLELQKRRPYITIDDMTVSMTDQRMGTHDVVMTLSSIEVKE
jgi:hypothetical protein